MAQRPGAGAYHGKKRPADCDADDQPLSKRFGRLQIDAVALPTSNETPVSEQARTGPNDTMLLDDTKHTIYIHDLDREIEEQDNADKSLTIIPGLGGGLSAIPGLFTPHAKPQCNELVLYREPISLAVPKGVDNVQPASIDPREGVRKEQESCKPQSESNIRPPGDGVHYNIPGEDQMDVDSIGA